MSNNSSPRADIAVVGLAVMGQNLALNIESRGYTVAAYNRTQRTLDDWLASDAAGKRVVGAASFEQLAELLQRPRRVLLMVKAGGAVDAVIDELLPYLEEGDIVIDGGNSLFSDTRARAARLAERGLRYLGTGISGGEEGALRGPSIMPGGHPEAYEAVADLFRSIAAVVDGEPCCTYIGADGAGHFVKMVHNGIEYADMQLITEAYAYMKQVLGMSYPEMQRTFQEWNEGELDSYLIEITADIFGRVDPDSGKPMVEIIVDTAAQKGTGKWTSQSALDLGTPAATIAEAVFARYLSSQKEERVHAASVLRGPKATPAAPERGAALAALRSALYASKICAYAQGFALMDMAAAEHGWELRFGEIATIWRGGCIIRARFLDKIREAYDRAPQLANLLLDDYFRQVVDDSQAGWREVVATCVRHGVAAPAFSSALAYFDSYRTAVLPANLLQAQRDYFGAHTYQRVDRDGVFHTDWTGTRPA